MYITFGVGTFWQNLGKTLRTRSAIKMRIKMPRTINGKTPRQSTRIPTPMIKEIDKIAREHPGLHYNRQQFVECAIREKIEKTQLIKAIFCDCALCLTSLRELVPKMKSEESIIFRLYIRGAIAFPSTRVEISELTQKVA